MIWNNIKIALRNLRKNKLFAVINIAGLAVGMTIYVFGGLLVKYEATHDAFFENSDRTYTVGSYMAPEMNIGIDQINTAWSAFGPIIAAELDDVEAVALVGLNLARVHVLSERGEGRLAVRERVQRVHSN